MKIMTRIWRLLDRTQRRQFIAPAGALGGHGLVRGRWYAAVVPFFAVLADPDSIERNTVLRAVYRHLHFANEGSFVLALGGAFIALVLLANAVNLFGMLAINRFALQLGGYVFCPPVPAISAARLRFSLA